MTFPPELFVWLQEAEAKLTPYEIAVAHLRAVAQWSDENMNNPIMARAARNCARTGLEKLGEL